MKSKIKHLIISSGILTAIVPLTTFAGPIRTQTTGNFTYTGSVFQKIILLIQDIIGAIMPIVTALLVLYFAYEVYKFMTGEGQDKGVHKSAMIKALLALFVWLTFFGIIQVVANSFGLGIGDDIQKSQTTTVNFN